jgi:hypothetical protein
MAAPPTLTALHAPILPIPLPLLCHPIRSTEGMQRWLFIRIVPPNLRTERVVALYNCCPTRHRVVWRMIECPNPFAVSLSAPHDLCRRGTRRRISPSGPGREICRRCPIAASGCAPWKWWYRQLGQEPCLPCPFLRWQVPSLPSQNGDATQWSAAATVSTAAGSDRASIHCRHSLARGSGKRRPDRFLRLRPSRLFWRYFGWRC